MKTTRRWPGLCLLGLGLSLATASGCQTWVPVPGLTLPSGWYLLHPPGYYPESPPFPLPRELATMQQAEVLPGPAGPLPPAVPPAGPPPAGLPPGPGAP